MIGIKRDYSSVRVLFTLLLVLCPLLVCPSSTVAQTSEGMPPPALNADFRGDPLSGCVPLKVWFEDLSVGEITSRVWNFGDGGTSIYKNPWHTYTAPGVYTVTLTIVGPAGTDSETKFNYITVRDVPEAHFTAVPTQGYAPLTVQFTDQSVDADSVVWTLGDGSESRALRFSHVYTAAGTYPVILKAYNPCGEDSTTDTIEVYEVPECEIDFEGDPLWGCVPDTVDFTSYPTGNVTSYYWEFGDGATSTDANPRHIYTAVGIYTVRLTIMCEEEVKAVETKVDYIEVEDVPTPGFDAFPDYGPAPLQVQFSDRSADADSLFWTFGDGNSVGGVRNPQHVYTSPGQYTVVQKVFNDCGEDSAKGVIIVPYPPIEARFEGDPTVACVLDTIRFTDLSVGDITTWDWSFGDGTGSTVQHPEHIYTGVGIYTVSLTVSGPGGSDTETKYKYITINGGPTADFDIDPPNTIVTPVRPGVQVRFYDRSIDADSLYWDFGDGSNSSAQDPAHAYAAIGWHTVTLKAFNECDSSTAIDSVRVDIPLGGELTLDLTASDLTISPLDVLDYSVRVQNIGDEDVDSVVVRDTIPALTSYVGGSASTPDGTVAYDLVNNCIVWRIGTVAPTQIVNLQFSVRIDPNAPNGALITDRAKVTETFPPELAGAEDEVTTAVIAADIFLEKTADPTTANPGDTVTYTVRSINSGDAALVNAILLDTLPNDFSYINGTATVNGSPAPVAGTNIITIDVGAVGIADSAIVIYDVEISTSADTSAEYINSATLIDNGGSGPSWGPVHATVQLESPPLVITKRASAASAAVGGLVSYLVTVENVSNVTAMNLTVIDTMPNGFIYIENTTLTDGTLGPEPITSSNPYEWSLGNLDAGDMITLRYTVQLSTLASPGINENVVWAHADRFRPSRATARVNVLTDILPGAIRGKVIIDCDGDGIPDTEGVPAGVDIYLDDGSQSRVNEKAMFFFSTVRAGEHAVKIDTRDLDGYTLAEGQEASVFVHVHETGEAYVLFRICPVQPLLTIHKQAAILPKARVTKSATIDTTLLTDSTGVVVDYEITIETNGGVDPTEIRVVDELPGETRVVIHEGEELTPAEAENRLEYGITVGQEKLHQQVHYSLEDLTPGVRSFLTNRIHLEGELTAADSSTTSVASDPIEVAVGPLSVAPPEEIQYNIVGAYFTTSKADLRPAAVPVLTALADSILKYESSKVRAEGHCDYRRIHTEQFPSNWELSFARAKTVVDWLSGHGIDSSILEYEGFAATRPVDTGHTPEAWQRNRRVEVFITGKTSVGIDLSALTVDQWEATTALEMNPVDWDTTFSGGGSPIDIDLNDAWEIALTVENIGQLAADAASLWDPLPGNTEYIDGSATVDDMSATVEIDQSGNLSMQLGRIGAGQKIVIRYRIRALTETMPTGGGAASIRVTEPTSTMQHESNSVLFE